MTNCKSGRNFVRVPKKPGIYLQYNVQDGDDKKIIKYHLDNKWKNCVFAINQLNEEIARLKKMNPSNDDKNDIIQKLEQERLVIMNKMKGYETEYKRIFQEKTDLQNVVNNLQKEHENLMRQNELLALNSKDFSNYKLQIDTLSQKLSELQGKTGKNESEYQNQVNVLKKENEKLIENYAEVLKKLNQSVSNSSTVSITNDDISKLQQLLNQKEQELQDKIITTTIRINDKEIGMEKKCKDSQYELTKKYETQCNESLTKKMKELEQVLMNKYGQEYADKIIQNDNKWKRELVVRDSQWQEKYTKSKRREDDIIKKAQNELKSIESEYKLRFNNTMLLKDSEVLNLREQTNNVVAELRQQLALKIQELNEIKTRESELLHKCQNNLNLREDEWKKELSNQKTKCEEEIEKIKKNMNVIPDSIKEIDCSPQIEKIKEEIVPYMSKQCAMFFRILQIDHKGRQDSLFFVSSNTELYKHTCDMLNTAISNIDSIDCTNVTTYENILIPLVNKLRVNENVLLNFYEDLGGAIRVYVRIKGSIPNSVVSKDKDYVQFKGCWRPTDTEPDLFGKFYNVYPENFTNKQIYTGCIDNNENGRCCLQSDEKGICRLINQLQNGYHLVLFGYGVSGSGKTHTLFGNYDTKEPGLVQMAIKNSGAKKVNIHSIFESTYGNIDFRSKQFNSGKFIKLYEKNAKESVIPKNYRIEEEKIQELTYMIKRNNENNITESDIFPILDIIDIHRLNQGRIRATPYNDKSSRSHLFIMFEFQFADTKGYLTIVDTGGRESTLDILKTLCDKPDDKPWQLLSMLLDKRTIPDYIRNHIFGENDASIQWARKRQDFPSFIAELNTISLLDVVDILKESIYINETLNQLILFFLEKQDKKEEIDAMTEQKLPINDTDKANIYNTDLFFLGKPKKGKLGTDILGMYTVLHKIFDMVPGNKTKFVMLATVRPDNEMPLCESTYDTLEFIEKVAST